MTNQDTKTELLPCPFCGGKADHAKKFAYCTECGAQGRYGEDDKEESARDWNTRAQPVPAANAEALREYDLHADFEMDGLKARYIINSISEETHDTIRAALQRPAPVDVAKLNPDMPAEEMRLHMGELTSRELLVARAAIRWANTRLLDRVRTEPSEQNNPGASSADSGTKPSMSLHAAPSDVADGGDFIEQCRKVDGDATP